ncbi:MAG: zinc-binding dehydrogenase [Thermoleophilia bacterium]|nr:zinc-binding dehydrogenase [Thermoleophilia bacterium]
MRAAVINSYGEPPVVETIERPEPGNGQEAVAIEIAGLNPVDLAIASGTFDAGQPPVPYVTGREGIGRLESGEMVWFDGAIPPSGSLAGHTVIHTDSGIPVPGGIEPERAIAFGVAGLAAWLSLEWRGRLKEGETVLVLGASGAVGQIAIQAARLLGAGRVVGAARSAAGRQKVAALGADAVIETAVEPTALADDPAGTAGLTESILEATGGGPDLVIDCLWGEPATAAIGAIKPTGRLIQVGNSAGKLSSVAAGRLRGALLDIRGHRNLWAPRTVQADAFRTMCAHAARGELEIEVEVIPLEEAAEAWRRQAGSPGLKLAIRP